MAADQKATAQQIKRAELFIMAKKYRDTHKREFWKWGKWYGWQLEGLNSHHPQVMTLAANRTGKTMSAGYHTALDLTGDYPPEYRGYRFSHAPNVMVSGVDNQQLKDVVQKELFGEVVEDQKGKKSFTGGWVHRNEIGRIEWSTVATGLARRIEVFSKFGRAMCTLRAFTQSKTGQGSLSFAGTSIDLVWIDECPPDDLVGQLVTRTMTGNLGQGGRIRYTMTPELGATKLVTDFMEYREASQKLIGPVAWDDCPHLNKIQEFEEETVLADGSAGKKIIRIPVRDIILKGIPEHEREMRSQGVPFFGSGRVYPLPESRIRCEQNDEAGRPITSIPWLKYIRAMDLGINHPTAIAWLAYDAEIDRIYVLRTYSESDSAAAVHAAAANSYLAFAPCVFPHDIDNREKGSGKTVRQYYSDAGLKNTLDFSNRDGTKYVEPGLTEINDRMRTDRFKVMSDCHHFFREMRGYHREDGQVVKKNDDVMDAVRYGAMMIPRYGVALGRIRGHKPKVKSSMGRR